MTTLLRASLVCLAGLVAIVIVACSTRLTGPDVRAVQLQEIECSDVLAHLADAGPQYAPERTQLRGCTCGARGILRRARQPVQDGGGAGCPQ